jgi:hypothetical protein
MRPLARLRLILLTAPLWAALLSSLAFAQGPGAHIAAPGTGRPACTSITNPVADQTWCLDGNAPQFLKVYSGGTFVPISVAGAFFVDAATYGFSPSATAAVNTAALQAAHDALPAPGGVIYMRAGSACYPINGEIAITKSVTFLGEGPGRADAIGTSGTCVQMTTINQNGFAVNTSEPVRFSNFALVSSVATAGAGIVLNSPGIVNGLSGTQQTVIDRMMFNGLWISVQGVSALFTNITGSVFWACQSICVEWRNTQHHDQGDGTITSSVFQGPSTAYGIIWYSGGGLRILGNKFLSLFSGISLNPQWTDIESPAGATSDFQIVNNSIENYSGAGGSGIAVLRSTGSKTIGNLTIVGNQLVGSSGTYGIAFLTANEFYVNDVIIADNLINTVDEGIVIHGGTRMTVHDNILVNITTGPAIGIDVASPASDIQLGPNRFTNVSNAVAGATAPLILPGGVAMTPSTALLAAGTGALSITVPGSSNGAVIALGETGGTYKYLRSLGGVYQLLNNARDTVLFSINDGGAITTMGSTGLTTTVTVRCEAATDKTRVLTYTNGLLTDAGTCA